jgi:large subunit ribosomal protein L15
MPKRGFTSKYPKEYQIVNLENLKKIKDTTINPLLLLEKGLIKSKNKPIKILGDGEIKTPIKISAHAFSKTALDKIKSAGGTIEVLNA